MDVEGGVGLDEADHAGHGGSVHVVDEVDEEEQGHHAGLALVQGGQPVGQGGEPVLEEQGDIKKGAGQANAVPMLACVTEGSWKEASDDEDDSDAGPWAPL